VPVFQSLLTGVPNDEIAVYNATEGLAICQQSIKDGPAATPVPEGEGEATPAPEEEATPAPVIEGEVTAVPEGEEEATPDAEGKSNINP